MASTSEVNADQISELLTCHIGLHVSPALAGKLKSYLDLLMRWNQKTNLTAVRDPREMVIRHFAESLQCALALPAGVRSLLDYGSGAGFPGIVCAMVRPDIPVVLAESQGKKAAFLKEVCRVLLLEARVYAGRVEDLPSATRFDAVTLRAVDEMRRACRTARNRLNPGGWLAVMTTASNMGELLAALPELKWEQPLTLRGTDQGVCLFGRSPAQ